MLEKLRQMPTAYRQYQCRPVEFLSARLGCGLTPGQQAIAASVCRYPATVVQSANGVGKTHVAAGLALWFLRVFPQSKVVTTAAPPLENLERLLWGEIAARLTAADGLFSGANVGYLRVELGAEWWLVGRAIPGSGTTAEREAKFSGVHAPHLLFIVDEGDAVPDEVYKGIESCMSGGNARLLVLFNPRASSGPVYQMIRKRQANLVTLDAFAHPNVIEGRDIIPGAVTRDTTVARVADWSRPATAEDAFSETDVEWFQTPGYLDGAAAPRKDGSQTPPLVGGQWRKITNPALSYMVLARFPGQAENQLINRAWVEAAQARWIAWRGLYGETPPDGGAPVAGLDVADLGVDANVFCARYGSWVAEFEVWSGVDILATGERAARRTRDIGAVRCLVDATGVGAGVPPVMTRLGAPAYRVYVGGAPTEQIEEGRFGTLRDQLWWRIREWLRTDPTAMLPPDPLLADELCVATYQVRKGEIKILDKEQMRKLLKRSPDRADGLGLTFAPATGGEAYLAWMQQAAATQDKQK